MQPGDRFTQYHVDPERRVVRILVVSDEFVKYEEIGTGDFGFIDPSRFGRRFRRAV